MQELSKAVQGPASEPPRRSQASKASPLGGAWSWNRTAHLGAGSGCCSRRSGTALRVVQRLLDLPHLSLLAHSSRSTSPPCASAGPARARGRWRRRRQRRRRRLGGHGVRREAARGRGRGCAQTEADAGGPGSQGSAWAAKGGLQLRPAAAALAMTPLSLFPVAERDCGQTNKGTDNGHGPARPPLFGKTLLVTSRPTDPVSRRNVRQMGGLEKGPKRPGRFSAEPETMVPAVGGTETEKEATGAEKGLTAHKRRLPGGRGRGRGGAGRGRSGEGGAGRHRGT